MVRKVEQWTKAEVIAAEDALIDIQFTILDLMEEKSLSHKELASMLRITPARVSQFLSSEANLTIKQVGRILYVLGLERPFKYLLKENKKNDCHSDLQKWEVNINLIEENHVWIGKIGKHGNDNETDLRIAA